MVAVQQSLVLNTRAKVLKNHLYTLGKFDVLFSSDIVMFLMTKVPPHGYNEFFTDTLTALHGIEHSLPKTIKKVVLRSVKVNTNDASKEYMFEPLFTNDTKDVEEGDKNGN